MIIDLFAVVSNPGIERDYELDISGITFDSMMGTFIATKASPFRIKISNNAGKSIRIDTGGDIHFTVPCDRCLKDCDVAIDLEFEKEFGLENDRLVIEDLDEPGYIEGLNLNTDQLVYDEILVNWPMKVLCKEDCKGICNKCGKNLNEGTCDCDRTVVDPRMAAIQDVFNKFKEV